MIAPARFKSRPTRVRTWIKLRVDFSSQSTLYLPRENSVTIFDLIFLLAGLVTAVTLFRATIMAIRGRRAEVLRILRTWGIGAFAYAACGLAVALLAPQRVMAIGDPWCFDDWCLKVEGVKSATSAGLVAYQADLRLSSVARRVSQRALGAWIYLIDDTGHRYAPDSDAAAIPLDVRLGPGESVTTSRTFRVPASVSHLGLITGHGGPYCGVGVLIIGGGGCLFDRPAMIRIR